MPGSVYPIDITDQVADLFRERRRGRFQTGQQALTWTHDRFVAPATYQLSYLPYGINALADNGSVLAEGTDYTVDYTTGIVTFTAGRTAGHVIFVSYVTTGDLLAASVVADTGAITENFNHADNYPTGGITTNGITWRSSITNYGISSNTLIFDGHANNSTNHAAVVALDVGASDGTFQMTGLQEASGTYYTGAAWRAHWDGTAGNYTSFWYVNNAGDVAKVTGTASPTVTVATNIGAIPNNATVTVACSGSTMAISVNGVLKATITDSFNATDTSFGAACDVGGAFGSADNFSFVY